MRIPSIDINVVVMTFIIAGDYCCLKALMHSIFFDKLMCCVICKLYLNIACNFFN